MTKPKKPAYKLILEDLRILDTLYRNAGKKNTENVVGMACVLFDLLERMEIPASAQGEILEVLDVVRDISPTVVDSCISDIKAREQSGDKLTDPLTAAVTELVRTARAHGADADETKACVKKYRGIPEFVELAGPVLLLFIRR